MSWSSRAELLLREKRRRAMHQTCPWKMAAGAICDEQTRETASESGGRADAETKKSWKMKHQRAKSRKMTPDGGTGAGATATATATSAVDIEKEGRGTHRGRVRERKPGKERERSNDLQGRGDLPVSDLPRSDLVQIGEGEIESDE